jgi:hypothetical protein
MQKDNKLFIINSGWSALFLFLSSCVFLFVLPVLQNIPLWGFRLCMSFVLLFSILSLEKVKKSFVFSGFAAVLLDWFSDLGHDSHISHYLKILTFFFVLWTVASLMLKFLKQKDVEIHSLLEAINGYLLLGILFSSIAVLFNNFSPGSFQSAQGHPKNNDLIYYTLITLTTTGYGDVLPVTPGAKNLSMIIAVCGQIYVAFLVGVLVGKYIKKITHE